MLYDVEIVIPGVAAVYPRHATLDLFGVRVHPRAFYVRYGMPVPIPDSRQHLHPFAKAQV